MRILVVILLLCSVGCTTVYNPATERKETYFIDETQEVAIGENIARKIIAENSLVNDTRLVSYVQRVGKKVAGASDRSYLPHRFYIIDEEGMNAFALPGGFVFVNKGLLEKVDENELAFVLGHELGHIAARHSIKRLQASLGMNLFLSIALASVGSDTLESATDIVYNVVSLGFSRRDELLADSLGVKYAHKAGYDPRAATSLIRKLEADEKNDFSIVFLRSHPPAEERLKTIEAKISTLQ